MAKGFEKWAPVIALGAFAAWAATRGGKRGQAAPLPSTTANGGFLVPPPPTFPEVRGQDEISSLRAWGYPYVPGIAKVSRDNPGLPEYVAALDALLNRRRAQESSKGAGDAGELYWDPSGQLMFEYYTPNTLRQVVTTAAGYFQIPAEWIWGQLYAESRRDPKARWYGGSVSKAVAAGTSALGIAQQTRTQYDREKAAGGVLNTSGHHLSVVPHMAIWRMAEALRRGAEENGGRLLTPDQVVSWWERGELYGPQGEGAHISKHGPSVHKPDTSTFFFGGDVPPWDNFR